MLAAARLGRSFGDRVAVDGVEFEVQAGEIFGLLGPNGAGKTTTLRMLAGLIAPTAGEVRIDGQALNRQTAPALLRRIGFLTESPGLWETLPVAQNLSIYGQLFDVPRLEATVEGALRRFDLWDRRREQASVLSKGMKQKLALARTLLHEPAVVLLDEPTANLDPQTSREVRELLLDLKARGRAIVVSTHNLDEIQRLADCVALIATRPIAVGRPDALRRELFGHRLRVRLASPPDAGALARVARLGLTPAVAGTTLVVEVSDPDEAAPAVVRALVEAGAAVCEVTEESQPLEEVYLRLLGGPAR
jgi:ABC-2 type transport system ATP-binding protein